MQVIAASLIISSAEVHKRQKRFQALPVITATHHWLCLTGKHDFLFVFYSDPRSKWNCCQVISCYSQQNHNNKKTMTLQGIYSTTFAM